MLTLKTKPKFLAADTSAPSSGDCAWYSSSPGGKPVLKLVKKNLVVVKKKKQSTHATWI